MRLIRWTPNRNLVNLPNELDRFFDNFGLDFRTSDTVWNPAVDVKENEKGYELKAEVPGLSKDEIKIDGLQDDWMSSNAIIEEVGLPSAGAFGGFDIKKLFLAYDDDTLYFFITLDKGIDDYFAKKHGSGYIGDIYFVVEGLTPS